MAQTKRKRRSKHRGNAAGIVEARGRTGRRPTEQERRAPSAADRRRERMTRPPSWRSAATRAALAALVFGALLVVLFKQDAGQAIPLTLFVFLFYIPLGYYTDKWVYQRKLRKRAQGG